ncbi:Na/Pi cotransporter family protein [Antarcticimicrobium sediminis]|uniref:Na/Pi cotransporter family protein n=1 Tax=Antarcticimicrobium sediminis TaxID=2546227 RepID=A0A4R5EVS6_9RHOB|nr:Na/Pi symporter [Antarcticimicrobium sediminis]TDE38942.1 Na/Pi cotransporter family protein [Antarcticimicrobium sediminis]
MNADIFLLIGGVGMFLLGMDVMTRALKDIAGSNLRSVLTRFTTTPLRGVLTGATATALIQSSSATTVMTVGFVGAGLMSLPQAMGVLYGANIGTTATGWLVSILGLKLQLETVAMVALLPASLLILLGRGRLARAGQVVAGLCLLLIGLDMMQGAMAGATALLRPEFLPQGGLWGLLALVFAGLVLTLLIQSSSATVALALVVLQGGTINLMQAAALVVGMNIGTTFTALLASLGGARVMRQAAVANLGFNVITSGIAFPLLLALGPPLERLSALTGPLTALLVFHTGFNVLGTALFLPLTGPFTALIRRLVPDDAGPGAGLVLGLDRALLSDARTALTAARTASALIAGRIFAALSAALRDSPDYRVIATLGPEMGKAIDELEQFLAIVRLPPDLPVEEEVYSALLHEADHLRRLSHRAGQTNHMATLFEDPSLRRAACLMGGILGRAAAPDARDLESDHLARLQDLAEHRTGRHRRGLLLGEHAGLYTLAEVFARTDAMRWLQRSVHHAERIGHYDRIARRGLQQEAPPDS